MAFTPIGPTAYVGLHYALAWLLIVLNVHLRFSECLCFFMHFVNPFYCMYFSFSLNSRFGTIAVPNIMVFHNAKAVARFNSTDRTLANIAAFITNVTGAFRNVVLIYFFQMCILFLDLQINGKENLTLGV